MNKTLDNLTVPFSYTIHEITDTRKKEGVLLMYNFLHTLKRALGVVSEINLYSSLNVDKVLTLSMRI